MLTDNSDIANAFSCACAVLNKYTVSATVLSLSLHEAQTHGVQGVLEHDVIVCLELFVISEPDDRWRWLSCVASLEGKTLTNANNDLITEVQLNGWGL